MKKFVFILPLLAVASVPAFATVNISAPANDETTGSDVRFVASATTTCAKGVASMGIYINNNLVHQNGGASIDTQLSLGTGWNKVVIEEWNQCGGSATATRTIDVVKSAGVTISQPADGATVSSPAGFVATATTACGKGVSAMGIYVNNNLVYKTGGASINTQLSLGSGWNGAVVEEWDNCGGAAKKALSIDVAGSSGNTLAAVQGAGGWNQWGELPPTMDICNAPCSNQVGFSMEQHEGSVSKSGNGTKFSLWGTKPYSAVLYSNPIMGQNSTLRPDTDRTLIPSLHNFTYNADFYVTDASVTQSLEFDINMYLNGAGMEWGTQCNHLADGDWDVWNNVETKWVSTGHPCYLNNGWNHVTIQVQRQSDNSLLYQSITMNGTTYTLNWAFAPFSVPSGWYGMTANYQMDGNYKMASNTTYLDNLNITYW